MIFRALHTLKMWPRATGLDPCSKSSDMLYLLLLYSQKCEMKLFFAGKLYLAFLLMAIITAVLEQGMTFICS